MLKRFYITTQKQLQLTLATLGVTGIITGCNPVALSEVQAQTLITPSLTPVPTLTPEVTNTPRPSATPWPTPTAWPSPTPWSQPVAWQPRDLAVLPLPLIPIIPTAMPLASPNYLSAIAPVIYNPPHGADVTGQVILRWEFGGQLAEDEFFDIRLKPEGSANSVFVDWTKSTEYELRPWSGWQAGAYTWQIGIIKGYMEGQTKHFIADTGRDSSPFLLKWHQGGGGGGGGGESVVTGGGGGGNNSGGS